MGKSETTMNSITRFATIVVVSVALLSGCSKLKNDSAPTAPGASVHGNGFGDSTSANFHPAAFRGQLKWNVESCKSCHGVKFDGGIAQKSCIGCHTQTNGPEACNTCHGGSVNVAPPNDLSGSSQRTSKGVGAHQAHLAGGTIGVAVACKTCHVVPGKFTDAGHVDDGIAEVKTDTTSVFYRSNAVYTTSTATCANTYCHGNFQNGNVSNAVVWNDTTGVNSAIKCGSCHGDITRTDPEERARPKTIAEGGTHPNKGDFNTTHCSNCHGAVVDANLNFVNKALHINGKLN